MRHDKRVAVVIPAYNEGSQIAGVLASLPAWVDHAIVVDDASLDETSAVVRDAASADPRIQLIRHDKNSGPGAATSSGYRRAIELRADVTAVLDGDGQMPLDELADIVDPVLLGQCDFAKANRLASGEAWDVIPRIRYLGNAALTLFTKIASGYYGITDSQTGFTAISLPILERLDLERLYPRYGYPNDRLVKLNVLKARVKDVPSRPVYNVGERSTMKVWKVSITIALLLFRRFWWRMGVRYVVRDFHPLVLFYTLGCMLLGLGFTLGLLLVVLLVFFERHPATGDTVLVSLAVSTGLLLVLFAMLFDFEHNQPLNPEG